MVWIGFHEVEHVATLSAAVFQLIVAVVILQQQLCFLVSVMGRDGDFNTSSVPFKTVSCLEIDPSEFISVLIYAFIFTW